MHGQERRISNQLLRYWNALKKDLPLPRESDFQPSDVGDIWDYCFVVRVEDGLSVERIHYSYLGSALVKVLGNKALGACIFNSLAAPADGDGRSKIYRISKTLKPITEEAECFNDAGVPVKYRQCLLPFADDAGRFRYIIGGMRWKDGYN